MAATTKIPSNLKELDVLFTDFFVKKAPALPPNVKEIIVKFAPWLTLILMLVMLPAVLAIFGIGTLFAPLSFLGGVSVGFGYILSLIGMAVVLGLEAFALPGLFNRQLKGWTLMYYASLLNAVFSLLQLNLVGAILGTALSLYILYQVKSLYK